MNNLKPITILVFGLFSLATLGESQIVEFKSDFFPVKFKYDSTEYNFVEPEFPGKEFFLLNPNEKQKNKSIFIDKKYNKNFYSEMEIYFKFDPAIKVKTVEGLAQKVKREEVFSWSPVMSSKVLTKKLNDMKPPIIKDGVLEQIFENIYCGRSEHSDGPDHKEYIYEGSYEIRRLVVDINRGVSFSVFIRDLIDSTEGAASCISGDCLYISSSPFFEKHYCEDNEALKNWDIGNYGRLVMNSVEINEDYFKPEALKKREEAIKKHEAKIAYEKSPEGIEKAFKAEMLELKRLRKGHFLCDKAFVKFKKHTKECNDLYDAWEDKTSAKSPWDEEKIRNQIEQEVLKEIQEEEKSKK